MSALFGKVCQNGYVVRDIEAAMKFWTEKLRVGPFFYVRKVGIDWFKYRGKDSALDMSVALANSGDVQLELIEPRNDAPSMYKDFLDSGREGMQHIAYWTTDFQTLYDKAISLGYKVAQEGSIGGQQGRFAYLDTELDQGTVIEISDISGPKGQFFSYIRQAAADWDGTNPILGLE